MQFFFCFRLALYLFYYATLLPLPFSPFSLCNVVFCNRMLFFLSSCHHRRSLDLLTLHCCTQRHPTPNLTAAAVWKPQKSAASAG